MNNPTKLEKQTMSTPTPCVVIDRDGRGNYVVYANRGVYVFSRSASIPEDMLYRFTPDPIPRGWLDQPFGYRGDGSPAEERAKLIAEVLAEMR